MVYNVTNSKNNFSTTLVSKTIFDSDFSGKNFFLLNFHKMTFEIILLLKKCELKNFYKNSKKMGKNICF
jgi:hypothetical protein